MHDLPCIIISQTKTSGAYESVTFIGNMNGNELIMIELRMSERISIRNCCTQPIAIIHTHMLRMVLIAYVCLVVPFEVLCGVGNS